MNARFFSQTLISAAIGGMATLALTGSPLWAQKPEATTPPANSAPGDMTNQHQQMMGQMQQMMEKCKSHMNQGMRGNGNAHTGGQPGQQGQGSTNHSAGN